MKAYKVWQFLEMIERMRFRVQELKDVIGDKAYRGEDTADLLKQLGEKVKELKDLERKDIHTEFEIYF